MRRRRSLNTASREDMFPVTLVAGDNGQIGIDLYNYVINNVDEYNTYYFKPDEIVTVETSDGIQTISNFRDYGVGHLMTTVSASTIEIKLYSSGLVIVTNLTD